jgi:isopentenyl diphosphate isomerase/L-lactate dehydrogenase-like FMN-dependent dehydrogenase
VWGGPVVVKGITDPDDARRAVDAGADAVSVSNHGGNSLDGTPASLRFLPGVVKAVGGEAGVRQVLEILRSGIDETLIGLGHPSVQV